MRADKQLYLEEISEVIQKSSSLFMFSYEKMDVQTMTTLRKRLRKLGGNIKMVPKRMFCKAASLQGLSFKEMKGNLAVISIAKDSVESAKVLDGFRKEHKDAIKILGGTLDGQMLSVEEFEEIAMLPGIQQLRAELIGILGSPLSGCISNIERVLTNVLLCLEEKSKK
ncbi:MAG: 50S ribosomal protein L10 [Chlamydiales bacterium]